MALALAISACSASETPVQDRAGQTQPPNQMVAVVIADFGTGTNPYHEFFRRPGWTRHPSEVIPGFPPDVPPLPITLGDDYAASFAADQAVWDGYKLDQLYWVPGTNLLLITPTDYAQQGVSGHATNDAAGQHGVGTSATVASSCPDCYVLVVQDAKGLTGDFLRAMPQRMPWVDLATQSSVPGNIDDTIAFYTTAPLAQATHEFEASGRLYFAGSGNGAVLSALDITGPVPYYNWDVPPWVTVVGGAYAHHVSTFDGTAFPACNLIEHFSGIPTEFIGNWEQDVPTPDSTNLYARVGGTSFATPEVAGRAGQVLLELRRELGDVRSDGALWAGAPVPNPPSLADGRLTNDELREVLGQAAVYFSTTGFDAGCANDLVQVSGRAVSPASPTPWAEMGWGYVGVESVTIAVDAILGRAQVAPKPPGAMFYMSAFAAARAAAYSNYPPSP
ncbi:MAG TPA: hypothetical protein VM074_02305 [Solimonas sp.]|nr:hypothetical protein [Solimonas sp.]